MLDARTHTRSVPSSLNKYESLVSVLFFPSFSCSFHTFVSCSNGRHQLKVLELFASASPAKIYPLLTIVCSSIHSDTYFIHCSGFSLLGYPLHLGAVSLSSVINRIESLPDRWNLIPPLSFSRVQRKKKKKVGNGEEKKKVA